MAPGTRTLAATLACIVGAVALPARAAAETTIHRDPLHDVDTIDSGGGGDLIVHRPHLSDPDVFVTRVTHRPHRIVIRLRVVELAPKQDRGLSARIVTPNARFHVNGFLTPSNGKRGIQLHTEATYTRVRCANLRQFYNYEKNVVRVRIPRSCVGSPGWVRVGVVTWRDLHDRDENTAFDDGLRNHTYSINFPSLTRRLPHR